MSRISRVLSGERPALTVALAGAFLLLGLAAARGSADIRRGAERDRPVELRNFNMLANAALASAASTENVAVPQWLVVSSASSGTPIEIATPIPHGLATGDTVVIKGVLGNEAANGTWSVTVLTPETFTLDGSAGGGSYAGGGSVFPAAGQPVPSGTATSRGELAWTPWFSQPAAIPPTEFFRSDGAVPAGEVFSDPAPLPATSFLTQEIDGSLFRPGERLCLSIEARISEPGTGRQSLILMATAAFASTRTYRVTFPVSALATEYRRFALCFTLDPTPIPDDAVLRVSFANDVLRGGGLPRPMYWARPMLNEGTEPAPWTAAVRPRPRTRDFY